MKTKAEHQKRCLERAGVLRNNLMDSQTSEFSVRELGHIVREPTLSGAESQMSILEALWKRRAQRRYKMLGEEGEPLRRFVLHKVELGEATWLPLSDSGLPFPNHKHDSEAVLYGLKPGVIVAIYPPSEGTAYESNEECPDP